MVRIQLDPIEFYGMGRITQTSDSQHTQTNEFHFYYLTFENSIWKNVIFKTSQKIDDLISEELINILASRISTILSKEEETWIGISTPKRMNESTSKFLEKNFFKEDFKVHFNFEISPHQTFPITAYFFAHEVGHA